MKEKIVKWYKQGLWSKMMVANAVAKKMLTVEEYTEITGKDGSQLNTDVPPSTAELAAENKLLKQQVSALTEQQSFYEDCIAEMAAVVYA